MQLWAYALYISPGGGRIQMPNVWFCAEKKSTRPNFRTIFSLIGDCYFAAAIPHWAFKCVDLFTGELFYLRYHVKYVVQLVQKSKQMYYCTGLLKNKTVQNFGFLNRRIAFLRELLIWCTLCTA